MIEIIDEKIKKIVDQAFLRGFKNAKSELNNFLSPENNDFSIECDTKSLKERNNFFPESLYEIKKSNLSVSLYYDNYDKNLNFRIYYETINDKKINNEYLRVLIHESIIVNIDVDDDNNDYFLDIIETYINENKDNIEQEIEKNKEIEEVSESAGYKSFYKYMSSLFK